MPANYSFDLGAWHLISLDSTGVAGGDRRSSTSDLAGRTNRCILAYWHHPRFSSGATHGNNAATAPLWDRLYAAGADVVLNGHDHIYERFAPQTPAAVASPTGHPRVHRGHRRAGAAPAGHRARQQRGADRRDATACCA